MVSFEFIVVFLCIIDVVILYGLVEDDCSVILFEVDEMRIIWVDNFLVLFCLL